MAGCSVGRPGKAAGRPSCRRAGTGRWQEPSWPPRAARRRGRKDRGQGRLLIGTAHYGGVAGMIPEFMWSPRVLVSLLILRKRNHIFLESSKDTRTPIELVNHTASPSYWASPISEDPCWSSLSARTQGPQAISITVWARFRMGPPNDHASHEQRRSRGHLSHAAAMLSVNPLHN